MAVTMRCMQRGILVGCCILVLLLSSICAEEARRSQLSSAFALHSSAPHRALPAYEALTQDNAADNIAGAALCGMALLLESGGGRAGGVATDLARAVELYNRAAALGNATAQFALGTMYAHGMAGVPHDEASAVVLLRQAALGGEVAAQLAMGYRYFYGYGVPKRCSMAVAFFELAANAAVDATAEDGAPTINVRKHINDEFIDGLRSTTGATREAEVVSYYEHNAHQGDVPAQVALGQLHYFGVQGVQRDLPVAAEWFSRASDAGDAHAKADLGHMYLHGLGVSQDFEQALTLLSDAAEAGIPAAVNSLGYMHLTGSGVPKSANRAFKMFKQAAEAHHAPAMYNLGVMSLTGHGMARDFTHAHKHFATAAHRSHLQAIHKLAHMHMHGIGTPQSCTKAVKLFMAVAGRGPWVKQLDDAYTLLSSGKEQEALWLYTKAAEQGYEVAQWNAAFLLDRRLTPDIPAVAWHDGAKEPSQPEDEPGHDSSSHDASGTSEQLEEGVVTGDGSVSVSGVASHDGVPGSDDASGGGAQSEDDTLLPRGQLSPQERAEEQALRLFERSSQQGNVRANVLVGDYYFYGRAGLQPDATQAAQHYQNAAHMRSPQAMFNLGYMHEYGLGVKPDLHLAKRYYDMAIETNPKSYFAVKLALYKLFVYRHWVRLVHWVTGAPIPPGILALEASFERQQAESDHDEAPSHKEPSQDSPSTEPSSTAWSKSAGDKSGSRTDTDRDTSSSKSSDRKGSRRVLAKIANAIDALVSTSDSVARLADDMQLSLQSGEDTTLIVFLVALLVLVVTALCLRW